MDDRLKQRLIGAAVLVLAAVIFVPMLLDQSGDEPRPQEHRIVPAPQPPAQAPARVVPLDSGTMAPVPAPPAATPPAKAAVEKSSKTPAKAPAKASVKTPAKTPAKAGTFAVQLGSFSKSDNARGLRDKLVAKGYTAFVKTTGSVTRVYVGPQTDRAEAEKMLEKLLAETKLKGIVVKLSG